jgi:hypothetical protein
MQILDIWGDNLSLKKETLRENNLDRPQISANKRGICFLVKTANISIHKL